MSMDMTPVAGLVWQEKNAPGGPPDPAGGGFADLLKLAQSDSTGAAGISSDQTLMAIQPLQMNAPTLSATAPLLPGQQAVPVTIVGPVAASTSASPDVAAPAANGAAPVAAGPAAVPAITDPGTAVGAAPVVGLATGPGDASLNALAVMPQTAAGGGKKAGTNDNSDGQATIIALVAPPPVAQLPAAQVTTGGTATTDGDTDQPAAATTAPVGASNTLPGSDPTLALLPAVESAAGQGATAAIDPGLAQDLAAAAAAAAAVQPGATDGGTAPRFVALLAVEETPGSTTPTVEAVTITIPAAAPAQTDTAANANVPVGASAQAAALEQMGVTNQQISVAVSDAAGADGASDTPAASGAAPVVASLLLDLPPAADTTPAATQTTSATGDQDAGDDAVTEAEAAAAALAQEVQALFSLAAGGAPTFATTDGSASTAALNPLDAASPASAADQGLTGQPASGVAAAGANAAATPAVVPGANQFNPTGPQTTGATAPTDEAQGTQTTRQAGIAAPIEQIKVLIEKGLQNGSDTIKIQLAPDDLGKVEIKVDVQDGQAKATVTADRPQTLQLLRADAQGLVQSLRQAGLSADTSSLSFFLRGEQQQSQQRQASQGRSGGSNRGLQAIDPLDPLDDVGGAPGGSGAGAASGVDISV